MSRNIFVIVGSPRKNGNSEILADAFIEGAIQSGNHVNKITLHNKRISACLDCKHCYRNKGNCVLKDDMDEVYAALAAADMVVLASPVYFYGFPAQLKCLIDRLHNPIRDSFSVKSAALLSVCADSGEEVFAPMIAMYRANLQYLHLKDEGVITADNVEDKGSIIDNAALEKARAFGRSLN